MEKFEFVIAENEDGIRLDKFLTEKFLTIKPEINRSKIQKLIEDGNVIDADKKPLLGASQKTKLHQKIIVNLQDIKPFHLEAKQIDFEIVFEDDDLLVINKPAGLTVHPGNGNQNDTLVNALLFTHKNKLSQTGGEFRPGIVHRLDKDTSGLMLVAKNDFTHQILSKNLQERKIRRSYLAFIYGVLEPIDGIINKNIVRDKFNRIKMSVSNSQGRTAITNYKTKNIFCERFVSLIECNLQTGRTHQIRVHLEFMKHSLIGDKTYNMSKKTAPKNIDVNARDFIANFPRQALHSYKIAFEHPRSGKEMGFEIGLPQDLKELEKMLNTQLL